MFTRPEALEDAMILDAVRDGWGFGAIAADYLAAGFGSHHWVVRDAGGERRFVTVDDLESKAFLKDSSMTAFEALSKAFAVAQELRNQELGWVVGPLTGTDGRLLHWLDARHSIAVFPYVAGITTETYVSEAEQTNVVELLAELHQATATVQTLARRETFRLPHRAHLEGVLVSDDDRWTAGPYAEPARTLLHDHAQVVRRLLVEHDRLAEEAQRAQAGWTITHGEPHSANVLRTQNGLRIIDWDTVLLAPPERDLWMLVPQDSSGPVAHRYTEITGHHVGKDLLRFYTLWWDLGEISLYVHQFDNTHTDTEDSREAWLNLQHFIHQVQER